MRIGIFTNTYLPSVNGVVNSIAAFRQGLEAEGHTVFVFGPKVPGHVDDDERVLRFPAHTLKRYPDYPLPLPSGSRLDRRASQLHLDLVHTQHPWLLGAWGQRFARRQGLPLVTTIHTQYEMYAHYAAPIPSGLLRPGLRSTVRRYCNHCHVVATPGSAMKGYLADLGVTRPIEVVPNATDLSGFDTADGLPVRQTYGIAPDEVLFTFIGRAAREKSLDDLIRAFAVVAAELPRARLMIVGGGPELERLRNLAARQTCADRILLPGPVPYREIATYHAAGDVFVTASVTEVQPLSLTEAMCAWTPVVGFNAGGINDMVADGSTGLLASVEEGVEGLARRMLRLGRDGEFRAALAAEAHRTSLRYHIPVATQRLLEVYDQAVTAARSRPV
ncbi:MAG: glycosyltransferase family 4 protein [Armatimonadetes bacterium]|nr:glycosyltransferase family 4 protein [Armatimonadota bacterium]